MFPAVAFKETAEIHQVIATSVGGSDDESTQAPIISYARRSLSTTGRPCDLHGYSRIENIAVTVSTSAHVPNNEGTKRYSDASVAANPNPR